MSQVPVDRFFDSLCERYESALSRCVPRYREMLWALLSYLPPNFEARTILELGCGTGNLSTLLMHRFPEASVHLVDLSGDSLEICRRRLGTSSRVVLEQQDFRFVKYEPGTFDLVISSIAIHHLQSAEKQRLFEHVHGWLNETGVFAFADQFAGVTDDLYENHIARWKEAAFDAGATDDEWHMWMQHQQDHDHHDSLIDQLDWLRAAGFPVVDCPWRYLLWTVVQGRKFPSRS